MGRIERNTKIDVKASVIRKCMFCVMETEYVFDFWLFISDHH
jgi:hypothetical protein